MTSRGWRALHERGVSGTGTFLYPLLADAGEVSRLMSIAERASPREALEVAIALALIGAVEELRELIASGVRDASRFLPAGLAARGDLDGVRALDAAEAREVAYRAAWALNHRGESEEPIWTMLDEAWPGRPALERVEVHESVRDTAEWVALAVASGVLGNAAYDGLRKGVQALWRREQKVPLDEPETRPGLRSEEEAFLLACVTVHEHCEAMGLGPPDLAWAQYEVMLGTDCRWVFAIHDKARSRRFMARIPPPGRNGDDVLVTIYLRR